MPLTLLGMIHQRSGGLSFIVVCHFRGVTAPFLLGLVWTSECTVNAGEEVLIPLSSQVPVRSSFFNGEVGNSHW